MVYDALTVREAPDILIRHPKDIYEFIKEKYSHYDQEVMLCVTLDGKHSVIACHVCTIGIKNKTMIHPREFFSCAISNGAVAVIACHNHPSGSSDPSDEDNQITERLKKAGKIIGIPLIDHIIFTKKDYFSFGENHIL
jgi:DNA repair protein RadC